MAYVICLLAAITFLGNGPDREIVYFRIDDCPACKMIQPAIDQLVADGWAIRSVDILKEPSAAKRWRVAEIPTVIVVVDGKEVERIVGSLDHAELKNRLTGQEMPGRRLELPDRGRRKSAGSRAHSTIGDNFPSKESVVGPNYPSDSSFFGPNHPSNRAMEDREDPFAIFGENHPIFYSKGKSSPPAPRVPSKSIENVRATSPRLKRYLPPGVKLPELPETMAATVRIRIKTEESESVGTGTIIDKNGDEIMVLTCGHLFNDREEHSRILVELFQDGKVIQLPATVFDYRNDELDLGLVKFRHSTPVPKVSILPKGQAIHAQDLVFSIGCDGGDAPSRRDTVISRLNRFLGPSNIEIAGAPVQGRSGGGLFDVRGRLIGVCVAADNESDEGLFVGPEAIYGQLEKLGMHGLFD